MYPNLYFVDDDYPTNRYHEIILSTIAEIGSFKIFDDSEIALSTLKTITEKPNFLFLDINMPRLDGWELVEAIQKSPSDYLSEPSKIFMLTTSLSEHDLTKQKKFPLIQKMIEKPITEKLILEILQSSEQTS